MFKRFKKAHLKKLFQFYYLAPTNKEGMEEKVRVHTASLSFVPELIPFNYLEFYYEKSKSSKCFFF